MKKHFRKLVSLAVALGFAALAVVDQTATAYAADSGCAPGLQCKVLKTTVSTPANSNGFEAANPNTRLRLSPERKATDAGTTDNVYLASDGGLFYTGTGTKIVAAGFCPQDGGPCAVGPGFYQTTVNTGCGPIDGGTTAVCASALDAGLGMVQLNQPCSIAPNADGTHIFYCKGNDANTVLVGAACLTAHSNDCASLTATDFVVRFSKP